ncbi:Flp pilus assembly complex ATPase component TadA [Pyxidicoccus parkwayensis]|uniref:Flp pilus assembly complex ATPase component TadA n=1 Tax=Pyxidicoccus parkwayensis TaxID=2813578 RepID=A0ABX7NZV4_9BACT|nr:ATPase, T2SS/T4P/T4SS family [Pyxidicoccus parkwaysis]QSQ23017.1 Flp pilus assembly complex ATPase component TadA [Pyxidicoccus parkwaysis]
MQLSAIIRRAREQGASDVHLEGGMPMALRVRGALRLVGEPLSAASLTTLAREVVGDDWPEFVERCSYDVSRTLEGQRIRINVLRSARGVGFAIRLLSTSHATLKRLNLHPDLRRLVEPTHGLVLVCGPTGSGKTSTLAALLQELNLEESRHIITVESPIEYALVPRMSFIRQREVGRDTPSFAQALVDAMREDPDVLMVGEMREPEVMRLTLNAAETGHLVLATVHSASAGEALARVVSAFAPEMQAAVCAQLADCLVGVVCQRLRYRPEVGLRVPECEVLMGSTPVKSIVRQGHFYKIPSAIETGAADGCWSFPRYAEWLARKTDWSQPSTPTEEPPAAAPEAEPTREPLLPAARTRPAVVTRIPESPTRTRRSASPEKPTEPRSAEDGVFVIQGEQDDLVSLVRELEGES